MPVVLGLAFLTNLMGVGDRVMELFQPKPGITDSLGHRAALRAVGKEMIEAHPVFGVGPGRVEGEFDEYVPQGVTFLKDWSKQHLHNIYYHYAAERGLPALALLLWFFGRILYDMARARFRDPEARWVIEGAIACTIAMMVSGWGEVNFSDSEVLGMWLAVVGCGYSASRLAQTS
jgi:O-antigen ligase